MTLRDDLVEALQRENDELRQRLRDLEEMFGLRIEAPMLFQLSRAEAMIFGALLRCELLTKQHAMNVFYSDRIDREPEIKIIDVFICKMRKKLKPFGIEIETVWAQGYRMPTSSKAIAAHMLEQARAA